MADEPAEALLVVTVDWERQSEEMLLVKWLLGDHIGSEAWIVGKPTDERNVALCQEVEAAVEAVLAKLPQTVPAPTYQGKSMGEPRALFRFIATGGVPGVKAIYGEPSSPAVVQQEDPALAPALGRLSAAALALVEAKLGG